MSKFTTHSILLGCCKSVSDLGEPLVGMIVLLAVVLYVQRSKRKITQINVELRIANRMVKEKHDILIRQNRELMYQHQKIKTLNNDLEALVNERTLKLTQRNIQLSEYAFFNAHKIRSPIATILGLFNLSKLYTNPEEQMEVLNHIREPIEELERLTHISQHLLDEDYFINGNAGNSKAAGM